MLQVSRWVGWNQSLLLLKTPRRCSLLWRKCPFLVPPPCLVRFNFRPITPSPCSDTPATANADVIVELSACIILESEVLHRVRLLCEPWLFLPSTREASTKVAADLQLQSRSTRVWLSHRRWNKVSIDLSVWHLCCLRPESGSIPKTHTWNPHMKYTLDVVSETKKTSFAIASVASDIVEAVLSGWFPSTVISPQDGCVSVLEGTWVLVALNKKWN